MAWTWRFIDEIGLTVVVTLMFYLGAIWNVTECLLAGLGEGEVPLLLLVCVVLSLARGTFSSTMNLSPLRTLYVYSSLLGHFISSGPASSTRSCKKKYRIMLGIFVVV